MGGRAGYVVQELMTGLRRNLLMTIATIVTITVSLTLLGAGLLMQRTVNDASDLFFANVEVSIFLDDAITQSQTRQIEDDLTATGIVSEVIYESKEDAFAHFQEIFDNQPEVRELVTPEDLPASFRVRLTDPERFDVIETRFAGYPGVSDVSDQRELLDRFFTLLRALRNSAVGVAILQGLAAGALVANTIRIAAFARREQTGIMKLVGASNWYIRLPFVLEGIVAGVVGALGAFGLLLVGARTILPRLGEQVQFLPIPGVADVFTILPLLIVLGAAIAAVSSFLSLRRFLTV